MGDEIVSPFEALKYIKNNILETTGQIIWGLVFTLYPDGRFNIEYDYNKPEGYEESDDEISIEGAVKSLQSLSDIQDSQR